MELLEVSKDRRSVSVVNEHGAVLVAEVPARLIMGLVPLVVAGAALVGAMTNEERTENRAAEALGNIIQNVAEDMGMSPQELRRLVTQSGLWTMPEAN